MDSFIIRPSSSKIIEAQPTPEALDDAANASSAADAAQPTSDGVPTPAVRVYGTNPWPYVDKYFDYNGSRGKNVEFFCKLCIPKKKTVSCNEKSLFNLRQHIKHHHPSEENKYVTDIELRKKRKRMDAEGSKQNKNKQPKLSDMGGHAMPF